MGGGNYYGGDSYYMGLGGAKKMATVVGGISGFGSAYTMSTQNILPQNYTQKYPYTIQHAYQQMQSAEIKPPKKENKKMFDNVKGYVEKHKDVLFTLGLVILVDHFMFKGALRERIKTTIEGVLKKAENMIENKGV